MEKTSKFDQLTNKKIIRLIKDHLGAVAILSLIYFLMTVSCLFLKRTIFDEIRYINAAQALTEQQLNQNWSHPVFVKWLIKNSIELFGNNPLGWRFPSITSGWISLLCLYVLSWKTNRSVFFSFIAGMMAIFNQALVVQSGTANLDSTMIAFFLLMLVMVFTVQLSDEQNQNIVSKRIFSGVFSGLSIASKWALLPSIFALSCLFSNRSFSKRFFSSISILIVLVATYLAAHFSLIGKWHPSYARRLSPISEQSNDETKPSGQEYKSVADILLLQIQSYRAQKDYHAEWHPQRSWWYEWPYSNKAVVYLLEKAPTENPDGNDSYRIVLYRMSYLMMIFGLCSLVACAYFYVKQKDKTAGLLCGVFLLTWLQWIFIPRDTQFLYYFLPSYLLYSLTISYTLFKLKAGKKRTLALLSCLVIEYVVYFPVLYGVPISQKEAKNLLYNIRLESL